MGQGQQEIDGGGRICTTEKTSVRYQGCCAAMGSLLTPASLGPSSSTQFSPLSTHPVSLEPSLETWRLEA